MKFLKHFLLIDYSFVLYNMVSRNIKLKYRSSWIGLLWTLLVPLSNALVYILVFQYIMRVNIPNYSLFILTGILPWTFYSVTITHGMESIVANQGLITKVPIPPHLFVFTETLTAFTNLIFSLPLLLVLFIISNVEISWALLTIPFYLGLLCLQAYSTALILSVFYVYFRDMRHIVNTFIQILFYGTPIVYTQDMVPEKFKNLLMLNPIASLFNGLHDSIVFSRFQDPIYFANGLIWTFVLFGGALFMVHGQQKFISENL